MIKVKKMFEQFFFNFSHYICRALKRPKIMWRETIGSVNLFTHFFITLSWQNHMLIKKTNTFSDENVKVGQLPVPDISRALNQPEIRSC